MKKPIVILAVFSICGVGYASETLPAISANCDDIHLMLGSSINTELEVGAYWKNPAVFPNPPLEDSTRKHGKPYIVQCPTLTVSDDGNMAEIKAKDYDTLIGMIPSYAKEFNLYGISGYRYPHIKEGFMFSGYSFNLENFKLKSSIYDLKEGMDLSKILALGVPYQTVLAYRVDGGELKPMIYDQKVSKYKADFENAKVIDIYQKLDKPMVVERLTIDKENGAIRMYRKSPFPKK